jgi:hypothetical protein
MAESGILKPRGIRTHFHKETSFYMAVEAVKHKLLKCWEKQSREKFFFGGGGAGIFAHERICNLL